MYRSNLEILKILSENMHRFRGHDGLCCFSLTLRDRNKITTSEYVAFKEYINSAFPELIDRYCWPEGKIEPRIEWLREQIKLLENQIIK